MDKFTKSICNSILKTFNSELFKNKTILITGANGLIGGFLSEYFNYLNIKKNYNIKLLLTSKSNQQDAYRLQHIIDNENVFYESIDLSAGSLSYKTFLTDKIDFCFYCAGYAQPSKFMSNLHSTMAINITGLHNTLNNIFINNKSAKVLYLSSSEVYANNDTDISHQETDIIKFDATNKRNCYILGKLSGETIVNEFRNQGFDAKSARVSLCFGPGVSLDDTRVMSEIVSKATNDEKIIKLFDEGSAYRRYLHISDCCVMLLNILNGTHSVYNIGGKEETTIYEMAKIIGDHFDKDIKKGKSTNTISTSAPNKVWISMGRYENEFGTIQLKSFKDGLIEFMNWYVNKKRIK